jgi:Holliday junction DNA helicase RuvB
VEENVLKPEPGPEDLPLDEMLRPRTFAEFVGQARLKENLRIYIEAAKQRSEPLDHTLFSGPPGLGKTTLGRLMAAEMGVNLKSTTGPALERPGDLVGLLTNLGNRDILFIDEIHRISPITEEYLYSAMEDYTIDVVLDQGPSARLLKMRLEPFTLVGATTREGLLSPPFRNRFGVVEKLEFYPPEDLFQIAMNSARRLGVPMEEAAARLMASRARGTPRVVNRFLRRIRDVAQVTGSGVITVEAAREGLQRLGVDEHGLGEMDRKILRLLLDNRGKPVGLQTIAVAVGEEEDTIAEVYEPFLMQEGMIQKSARGRVATARACELYGDLQQREGGLFQ